MTREQAINYLFSSGFSEEQVNEIVKALEPIKNNLGVDCISRDDVRDVMQELWGTSGELMDRLMALPSVTLQVPKPMVEIDLYSVIKQKYLEREVLDKIRAEIRANSIYVMPQYGRTIREADVLHIIDKYKAESER